MPISISRFFTEANVNPLDQIQWTTVNVDRPVEAPSRWSETAVEIAASKYLRRPMENSVRQLIERVTRTIREVGEQQGYFQGEAANAFEAELAFLLVHQMASFNSPVYFNVGIFPRYGILGSGENFVWDGKKASAHHSAYVHPQASACFIQDVSDDLIGIFDLLKSEAKLFKYGSGTGTNFSRLRGKGEPLDAGGESTGLLAYLEIFDKAAQAIKSGGTTRRAAKMVVLDADHPEVLDFIRWKMLEERKARVLLANGYSGGMEGEAFRSVSGQNSNNSVRVTDEFLKRAIHNQTWTLKARRSGEVVNEIPAAQLLREMARAAWECADPGIQYHDTIQKWHMCPSAGEIRSSNPCSEYMFLDDSACNLASLNLVAFLEGEDLNWPAFRQAVRIMLLAQEILVDYASYPTAAIAENSHNYRPLGLGYANLGALLMRLGLAYGSDQAAKWTSKITGALHALALKISQELAVSHGAFTNWERDRGRIVNIISLHKQAWMSLGEPLPWVTEVFEGLENTVAKTGLRNAQVTLLAPTGTIGLLMDCDTLGIEPDFALIKRKTLAGGGEWRLINSSVAPALARLGYSAGQIKDIEAHVRQTGSILAAKGIKLEHLPVFDCAVPPGGHPERRITAEGHLKIMAAAQPFLSGAISKTVNLPATATVEDVERIFLEGWRLGLKALSIYRDSSKSLQPLCAEC